MSLYPLLLKNAIMPIADRVMHTKYMYYLKYIESMNKWSSTEIKDWQNELMQKLINHVYNNTIYYREVMKELKLSPSDFKIIDDLKKLPVLKKEYVVSHFDEFVPTNINKIKYDRSSTGGSTGDPMRFLSDIDFLCFAQANRIYSWQHAGYNYGDRYAVIGASSLLPEEKLSFKHKVLYGLVRKIPFNGMNLSDNIVKEYLNIYKKRKIRFIYGYASSLFLLAKYVLDKQFEAPEIKACFSTSEILTENYRKIIRKAFNCEVMDCYGAKDGGIMGYEINKGHYHVGYNSIVEINDSFDSDSGKILSTNIKDFAFPLIRYEIGDEIELLNKETNEYSFNGQVITKIYGRISDVIRLENGNVLTGPGFTILFKDLNVKGYQIKKEGKLGIKINIQKGESYSKEEEKLIYATFKKHAGSDCEIKINYIDEFEDVSSGKLRYFIS